VVGDFLFVEVRLASNERRVVVLPRPLDCFALRLEGGEHVVRVILDYEVVDWAAFLAALWTGFDVDVRRTSLSAARQRLLPHVQYLRLAACYLDCVTWPACHDGPREWRYVGNAAVRGIGFVFAHDPEGLFAAIMPAQRDRGAEGGRVRLRQRADDFRACAPGPPIPDLAHRGSGGVRIVACDRLPVSLLEACEGCFDRPETFGRYQIAMRGDRPVGEILNLVFSFFDKSSAHGGYRCRTGRRLALSASMRFEASALVSAGANASGSPDSSESVR
jgi:hypothetical protein